MWKLISKAKRRFFPPLETLEGYEHPELIDVILRKTRAYRPVGTWNETAETVLDFGGGCGLHYLQANSSTIRWAVVETPAMVAKAKDLSTGQLQFFTRISDAIDWLGGVDLMHSDGAIQYTPSPEIVLKELCGVKAKQMLWRRVFLAPSRLFEVQTSYLSDNGPGSIKLAEKLIQYRRIAIDEGTFLNAHARYELVARGEDWFRFSLI